MRALKDWTEVVQRVAISFNRPVLYLSFCGDHLPYEYKKAAPFLTDDHIYNIMEGHMYIICKTQKEMRELYNQVVGDDGPTKANPYNGPARVYALTCSAKGVLLSNNT